jgi:hypothetical protein
VTLHLYQSVRPSESAGLNWGRVDPDAGLATIARSRNLGEENAPKTRAARRVIHLKANVGAILRSIKPLHAKVDTPVFINKLGERIKPDQFRKDQWYRALRALNIRPRDFYSCKDTAISLDITAGENAKKIAQEAGISLSTLERNYGIYLDRAVQEKVQQEVQRNQPKKRKRNDSKDVSWRPRRDLNPCRRRERPVSWARLDDGDVLVSRAGFEPATLCLKGRCSTA